MADQDTIQLAVEATGREGVRSLSAEVEQFSRTAAAAAEATRTLDVGMKQSTGHRDFGYAMLQASQTLDDLQYGIRGVVNNVPMLLTSLGLGTGVAGIAQVAMIGINQLVNHMGELENIFGKSRIEAFTEEMDKLVKATKDQGKAAEDTAESIGRMFQAPGQKQAGAQVGAELAGKLPENFAGNATLSELEQLEKASPDYQKLLKREEQLRKERARAQWIVNTGQTPEGQHVGGADLADARKQLRETEDMLKEAEAARAQMRSSLASSADVNIHKRMTDAAGGDNAARAQIADELERQGHKDLADKLRQIKPETADADERKRKEVHDFGPTMEDFRRGQKEDFKRATEFGPTMDDFRKGHKDQVGRYASALQEGFNEQAIFGNGTRTWVENQLSKQGVKEEDLDSIAGDVMDKLRDAYDKKVSQEAGRLNTDKAGAEAQMRHDFVEKRREWQMQEVEANMGVAVAQRQLWADLYKAPERIAMTDVARHAESGGAKDQLQIMREQLAVMKAIEQATKVANHPPKLGR